MFNTQKEFEDFLLRDDIQEQMILYEKEIGQRFPEMRRCINFPQNNTNHHLDVYRHTALALSFCKKNVDLRMALFFHDIGKPVCYQDEKNGIRHFWGHPFLSAKITKRIMKRMGYPQDYINKIVKYVANHDEVITDKNFNKKLKIFGYKKLKNLLHIQRCDAKAHHPGCVEKRLNHLDNIEQKLMK